MVIANMTQEKNWHALLVALVKNHTDSKKTSFYKLAKWSGWEKSGSARTSRKF